MPGFVAIIAHDPRRPVTEEELVALERAYTSLRGAKTGRRVAAGEWARAAAMSTDGSEDDIARHGESWAAVSGVVYGRPLDEPLGAMDGQFAFVVYDAERSQVTVATDPHGMHAVYVAEGEHRTYVSTSALALAKHLGRRANPRFVHAFLVTGYHFGGRTHWDGIERLEPGAYVSFRTDGRKRGTYSRPSLDEDVARLPLKQAAEHAIEVATETYRSRLGGGPRVWVDLTGGYDTRLLALLLRRAGVDFEANTNGRRGSPDVRLAERIARDAGWRWTRFDLPDTWEHVVPDLLEKAIGWGDGHLDVIQLARVLWGHSEKGRVHRSLLIGGGGEHFRGFAWQQEFLRAGRSTAVNLDNWVDMRLLSPITSDLLPAPVAPDVRADVRERMAAWAKPYASYLNTAQLDVLYAYKMTGHFGAYLSAAGAFVRAELPFYYVPVWTAAFSTSHRHRSGHRLMRHMIERLDPRIAAIPTSSGGPAQPLRPANVHRFVPYYARLGRKAFTKIAQKGVRRSLLAPKRSIDGHDELSRRIAFERLTDGGEIRVEDLRSRALYDDRVLGSFLARALHGEPSEETLVRRVITVELALRAADSSVGV
jgi:hypothetical protein